MSSAAVDMKPTTQRDHPDHDESAMTSAFHGKRFIEVDEKHAFEPRKRSKTSLANWTSSVLQSQPRPPSMVTPTLFNSGDQNDTELSDLTLLHQAAQTTPMTDDIHHRDFPQVSDEEGSSGDSVVLVKDPHPLLLADLPPFDHAHPPSEILIPSVASVTTNNHHSKMERRSSDPLPAPTTQKAKHDRRCSLPTDTTPPEYNTEKCLGTRFVPGNWDVVCGRGKNWSENIANRRFRVLVAMHLKDYFSTISRARKSVVINAIVNTIQTANGEGFVKKRGNVWYRITTKEAREKVSHCLRDCLMDSQHEQMKWSKEQQEKKLKAAQNHVFRGLELMG